MRSRTARVAGSSSGHTFRSLGRARGFTLTELLVAVSILGILAALAVPGVSAALRRSMIASAAHDLLGALSRARIEAQRAGIAGVPYTVCASSESATPASARCTGGWAQGAIVFADLNGNGERDPGEAVALALPAPSTALSITVRSTLPYVLFAPNGMLHGNERGARFTFSHARDLRAGDVQHLCVLRSGLFIVREDALRTDPRFAPCRDL